MELDVIWNEDIVCRLGLTAFPKIFDFVKNVWFPITQQNVNIENNKKIFLDFSLIQ